MKMEIIKSLPVELSVKGEVASRVMMCFMDAEMVSVSGRRTYLNIEESYIMGGPYDFSYLEKVYRMYEKEVKSYYNGKEVITYEVAYEILDKKEDMRIRAEGVRFWNDNGLGSHFEEMAISKMGGIEPEKLLRLSIINDALKEGDNQMANKRLAVDILGMKVKEKPTTINLRLRGGNEIIEATSKQEGGGFLSSVKDIDLDGDDD